MASHRHSVHTDTQMQPGADSDTKEVEVTQSLSEAINLCQLKLCVCVAANSWLKKTVCVCVCLHPDVQ